MLSCFRIPETAISPRHSLQTDMNRSILSLIEKTAGELREADQALWPEGEDYSTFCRHAETLTDLLIQVMFPHHAPDAVSRQGTLREAVLHMEACLSQLYPDSPQTEEVIAALLQSLPEVRRRLQTDLEAAYAGDPAAKSLDEIILCYPAFTAISTYRLAHILYQENVPLLPRVMTEYAHRLTGIDIHPGAQIGDYFFIDHGTGVVIGETTTIGQHVKLYQHVTLGAKSFAVGEDGTLVKGIKRHPDIGDRVVVYSGATILGGDTHIGNDCVIGGSVWLTHSVEAGKMVLAKSTITDPTLTRSLEPETYLDSAML